MFSRDLTIEGIDQKGIHMNECGSKNTPTLCLKGAPDVALKENHAATRQRVSLMTTVTSDETRAARPGGPPVEVMFKGETKRVEGCGGPGWGQHASALVHGSCRVSSVHNRLCDLSVQ